MNPEGTKESMVEFMQVFEKLKNEFEDSCAVVITASEVDVEDQSPGNAVKQRVMYGMLPEMPSGLIEDDYRREKRLKQVEFAMNIATHVAEAVVTAKMSHDDKGANDILESVSSRLNQYRMVNDYPKIMHLIVFECLRLQAERLRSTDGCSEDRVIALRAGANEQVQDTISDSKEGGES